MSTNTMSTNNVTTPRHEDSRPARRLTTETKASHKTTELFAYVITVIAVLVASAVSDEGSDFGPQDAWFFVTLLTIGYLVSRGLAKSASRDSYDADNR